MNININGESRSFAEGISIRDVLDHMGLLEKPVVVELNLEIVSKERWEGQCLKEGDQMEVIGFVGGGANHTGEAHLYMGSRPSGSIRPGSGCSGSFGNSSDCRGCCFLGGFRH